MTKQVITSVLLVLLIAAFTLSVNAQDTKKEAKKGSKMEMSKSEADMGPLKSVTCDPACGFCVKSHSEKELISMVKMHAKKMHKKEVTDKDVKGMMKNEEESGEKKTN